MITIKNVSFNVMSSELPYTYTFSHDASCNVSFSNATGTSSSTVISTDISFEDDACFTGTTVSLTISSNNVCSEVLTVVLTDPCAWTGTIGSIVKVSNLNYIAPTPAISSEFIYVWSYNVGKFTRLEGENELGKTLTLVKLNPNDSSDVEVHLTIVDTLSGCQTTISYTDSLCQPTLNATVQAQTGAGTLILPLTGNACDGNPIDWNTLEFFPDAGFATNNISITLSSNVAQITFADNTPTNAYFVSFRVANTVGIYSDYTAYTFNYTKVDTTPVISLVNPSKDVLNPGIVYNWGFSSALGDFTGAIDEVIISNPANGTASVTHTSVGFVVTYQADDYSTNFDQIDVTLGYLGQYSALQSITIDKMQIVIDSITQGSTCTDGVHDVTVGITCDAPIATSIKSWIQGNVGTINVAAGVSSPSITVSGVACAGVNALVEVYQSSTSGGALTQTYATPSDITREITFAATWSQKVGCIYNLNVVGTYSDIQGGILELLINGVLSEDIGNGGCCTCSTVMAVGESGTFNCIYQVDATGLPTSLPIQIRSSVDNAITATVTSQNLSGC